MYIYYIYLIYIIGLVYNSILYVYYTIYNIQRRKIVTQDEKSIYSCRNCILLRLFQKILWSIRHTQCGREIISFFAYYPGKETQTYPLPLQPSSVYLLLLKSYILFTKLSDWLIQASSNSNERHKKDTY